MATTAIEVARGGDANHGPTWKDPMARLAVRAAKGIRKGISDSATGAGRRRTAAELNALSDAMLKDIGLTRDEIGNLRNL